MDDTAIKIEHVSKSFKLPHERHGSVKNAFVGIFNGKTTYEKQHALQDISFEVKKGDFFGIVGRNGSGKSTLLKLISEIYYPDKGKISVNGSLVPFIELGVGFNPELSGRDNVFLNGALLGFSREEIAVLYDEIVEFAELEKFMDQKLKNYSSGMRVRLAFSVAIQAKSDILILDEVLAVGDAAFQQKCFNYFEQLKQEKKTIVFVTHDMNVVKRFCNKAIYLENGEVTYEGSPFEIADQYLEKNIAHSQKYVDEALDATGDYDIKSRISKQSEDRISLEISYDSKNKNSMYVGISIIKDGNSVAEITTSPNKPLNLGGKLSYTFKTENFNGGVYQLVTALFKLSNREPLAISKDRPSFVIKGSDITRGGAFKLPDEWKYEQK